MRRVAWVLVLFGCDDGAPTRSVDSGADQAVFDARIADAAPDAGTDAAHLDAEVDAGHMPDIGADAGEPVLLAPMVTEVVASNRSGLQDEDGDRPDWIELYNPHTTPIALGEFTLDDGGTPWPLPDAVLEPFSYRVVFASGKDRRSTPWHTDFRISSEGETICLARREGVEVQRMQTPAMGPDQAFGLPAITLRAPDAPVRYRTERPARWFEPAFDDSGWDEAPMGIGVPPAQAPSPLAHQAAHLRADWRFDQADEGQVADGTGAHPGQLEAGAALVAGGRAGRALGGPTGWMAAADPEAFDFAAAFTWSVWFKGADDSGALISRNPVGTAWNQGSKALFIRGGTVQWDSGWVGNPNSRVDVTDDTWHHVAVTYAPDTDAFVLYVDGVPQVDTVFDVNRFPEDLRHNGGEARTGLFVGQADFSGGLASLDKYDGLIDDVSIWSTALPPEDVALLAEGARPGPVDPYGDRLATALPPGTSPAAVRLAVSEALAPHLGIEVDPGMRWWIDGIEQVAVPATDLTWRGVSSGAQIAAAVQMADAWFIRLRLAGLDSTPGRLSAPTPGSFNAPAVASGVQFSRADGLFSAPFDLTLESDGGAIHFTLDGRTPTRESPMYAGPLRIEDSVQVTARVFDAERAPGPIGSVRFVRATAEFLDAERPLPTLVLARLGLGAATRADSPALLLEFAPDAAEPRHASRISMRVRGQSSANQPKRPYRIELQDTRGDDRALPLLDLPAEADWVLHAPFTDQTLVRNAFVYGLGRALGLTAPAFAFCEVYVQSDGAALDVDDNRGVYLLVERIEPDTAGLALSEAGALLKFEADVAQAPIVAGYRSLEVNRPEPLEPAQAEAIADQLARFEAALFGEAFADPEQGYAPLIDVDSFVNLMIINELVRDQDAYVRSAWLHFEVGGPIVMGPLWDYNLAAGTGGFFENTETEGWQWQHRYNQGEHGWFARLMTDPLFAERFALRWATLREGLLSDAEITARIEGLTAQVAPVAARNFSIWNTLGRGRVNGFATPAAETWPGQVSALHAWLRDRTAWIDAQLASP